MALGAARQQVLWLVLRRDLALIAAGLTIGAPLGIAAARLIQSLLLGVEGADPGDVPPS